MSIKDKLKNEISIRLKYISDFSVIYVDAIRSVEKLKWHYPTITWSSSGLNSIENSVNFSKCLQNAISDANKLKTEIDMYNSSVKED